MEQEHLADVALKALKLTAPEPDLTEWKQLVDNLKHPEHEVKIAVVGKYTQLHDSYLSVAEALKHGGIACKSHVDVLWVDSETLTRENCAQVLAEADGFLVPGGFGKRGTEGMILATQYARENGIPFLGICLGMQMAIVEFARNVLGYADANSTEFDPESSHPMIHILPEKAHLENLGGTLRLGAYPCRLATDSVAYTLYGSESISERHRHRYEVNNDYREALQAAGMKISGTSPDGHIVEMIEVTGHPYFTATQAHPEFKSRPNKAHPLFRGLIAAAVKRKK
jgi:CTP synthase